MPKKDEVHRKRVVVEEIKEPAAGIEQVPEAPEAAEEIAKEKAAEVKVPETKEPKEANVAENKETKETTKEEPQKLPEEKKSLWYIFWIMIPVAVIVGALAGGVFYFLNSVNKNAAMPSPTPTITASPTPSASSSAQVDLTKYQVKILNGSGIAGEAGKVQDILTSAGFKVSGTGNAATYDYTDTIIQIAETVSPDYVTKLTETLAQTYSVASKTQVLPAGEGADVVVIVGSSKAAQ